jgi:hypothetical protein
MAIKIRLARMGAKKQPFYRVVVTNSAGTIASPTARLAAAGSPVISTQPVPQVARGPGGRAVAEVDHDRVRGGTQRAGDGVGDPAVDQRYVDLLNELVKKLNLTPPGAPGVRIFLRGLDVAHSVVHRGSAWARLSDHAPLSADLILP